MINMVEAGNIKLKDHFWYVSERLVPMALFNAKVADCDEKKMAIECNPKYQKQAVPDCQQMPETEDFRAKLFKLLWSELMDLFELLLGNEPAFLTKRV